MSESDYKKLVLRFTELAAKRLREPLSTEESVEVEKIPTLLDLKPEEILAQGQTAVEENYVAKE